MNSITTGIRRRAERIQRNRTRPTDHSMHFHMDATGRAFVCDLMRCDSARLTLGEASETQASVRRWARRP